MKAMARSKWLLLAVLCAVSPAEAIAAEIPAPPSGWEAPPPLAYTAPAVSTGKEKAAAKKTKKPALPECCGYDALCCTRQTDIDGRSTNSIARVVSMPWSSLSYVEVKRAPKDKPGIEGVPPARFINESGQPFPWVTTPGHEIRLMPPGQNGETLWRSDWTSPFFEKVNARGMGYGSVHFIEEKEKSPDKGASMLVGLAYYLSFLEGQDGKIIMDRVVGELKGTPVIQATAWAHAEMAPIVPSLVNAYREKKDDKTGLGWFVWEKTDEELQKRVSEFITMKDIQAMAALPDCERVVFALPEVLLGFESKDVKTDGGHFPDRRESAESFTRYTLPAAPGYSGWVTFMVMTDWVGRWFPKAKDAPKLKDDFHMALSVSQTQAEKEPRVLVVMFKN